MTLRLPKWPLVRWALPCVFALYRKRDDCDRTRPFATRQVLAAVDALLARAGTDKTKIVMCQIFLADLADFAAMNTVWEAWVAAGHTPPRATVQAALARPEWKIEMVVTAAL